MNLGATTSGSVTPEFGTLESVTSRCPSRRGCWPIGRPRPSSANGHWPQNVNWYLWWQGKIEGVLYGTEVRVAEHGVRKGAEDVSVGEGMKNGVWKTFCHWHHATGALPGLPLNPKIKEPWIFFSQVKPTRLLIEEGLREVKDLIKILAAAGNSNLEQKRNRVLRCGQATCVAPSASRSLGLHRRPPVGQQRWTDLEFATDRIADCRAIGEW